MAAVTTGLRAYLATTVEKMPDQLIGLVPRNVRPQDGATAAGNRTWSIHVPLPVGTADPGQRLRLLQEAVRRGKEAEQTFGTATFEFDVTLSNVPLGDAHAIAGHRIEAYPAVTVPLQGRNRLVALATSYHDTFTVTFVGDGVAFPDIERLASHTLDAFMMHV
jgi:hypothetical protein